MSIFISSTISVSQKKKLDCEEMAEFLGKHGIATLVTSNISMTPTKEFGCQLTQSINSHKDIKTIWQIIKKKYNFQCAYLHLSNNYSGCILTYLRANYNDIE